MGPKEFLKNMPGPLETAARHLYAIIPPPQRYGRVYRETIRLLADSQNWSAAQHLEYQSKRLRDLLNHVHCNVPFYRRLFNDRGYSPANFNGLDDLKRLPFSTRDTVRQNNEDIIARDYPKSKLQPETTSGSTGNPLGFYFERGVTDEIERAFIHTLWNRVGFRPGDRCAVFGGRLLKSAANGKYWQYDPVEKNLYFSAYHLTDENLAKYVQRIRKFQPRFIFGYPSAVTVLAQYMLRENVPPFPTVMAILCGSESLFPGLREILRSAFRCRVFSWYGHTERAVLAGECEHSQYYHIFPQYGVVELIRPNGEIIDGPDEIGEVVATGLNNFVFPFIRYRTGDLAAYSNERCSCGREYRLFSRVEGRVQEFIVTQDGRKVTMTAFYCAQHFKAFARIRQLQFIQESVGHIKVKLVRLPEFSDGDEEVMRTTFLGAVQGKLKIDFEYVDDIPRTPNGKHRLLIQHLPLGFEVANG
jgi:phenylacetate-CoA ligase